MEIWPTVALYTVHTRWSDIINAVTCRHVGGIFSVNKSRVKTWKSENSYAKVILRPCFSTGVEFHTRQCPSIRLRRYTAATIKYTSNMAAVTVVNRMAYLSLHMQKIGHNINIIRRANVSHCRNSHGLEGNRVILTSVFHILWLQMSVMQFIMIWCHSSLSITQSHCVGCVIQAIPLSQFFTNLK